MSSIGPILLLTCLQAGQFYSATWWLADPVSAGASSMRAPSPSDIRTMLSDICTNSGAEIGFEKLTFAINGSDDAVKAAMMVIHQIPFVKRAQYQIRVKIELANEHKEFVSGKKNGKINKIMGQSIANHHLLGFQTLMVWGRQRPDHFRWLQRIQFLH